jgi:hypothetical protein
MLSRRQILRPGASRPCLGGAAGRDLPIAEGETGGILRAHRESA